MTSLVEKYRPRTIDGFVGMERAVSVFKSLIEQPYESAWLLVGPSGLGKTTMALAFVEQIAGELHHIPSRNCTLETVEETCQRCHYVPFGGGWHVLIIDEADQMTRPAQLAFLSKLDTTAAPPNTIFIFTANATNLLEDRFLSRVRTVKFSTEGILEPAAALLATIWRAESPPGRIAPDFRAIVREAKFNVRQAIMDLEMELLAPSDPLPPKPLVIRIPDGDFLDARAMATLLGINVATLYNRVKCRKLPEPRQHGRKMVWDRSAIGRTA